MTNIRIRYLFSAQQWVWGLVGYIVVVLVYAFLGNSLFLGFLVVLLSLSLVFFGIFTVLFRRFVLAVERIADEL